MKMNKSLLIATSLLAATALQAQEIKVKDKNVEQSEGTLLVGMTLDFSGIEVPAGRSIVCTPVVASGDSIRPLTPIILNGRDRHILYERTGRTTPPTANTPCAARRASRRPSATPPALRWHRG